MPMRILYFSQYFPPEVGATQTRAFEMASNLARSGHQVTMITEVPNHPSGIIQPDFRYKLFHRSSFAGIDVIRLWVKTSPKKSFINRILFYLSFMINAAICGLIITKDHYDVIVASSPPLFVGGSALVVSRLRKIPFIFEVRDLWPESAVVLGEVSNPRFIKLAEKLEESCYENALKIVVVTKGIYARLVERGISADKIELITNGANVELFQFSSKSRNRVRKELHLNDKFVIIYTGTFGIAQGMETIIDVAERLKADKNIHFLLVGSGPKKSLITNLSAQKRLKNITIFNEQPRELIPDYLSASDTAWIPLRNFDLFKGALPSKMFDAWACELPLLLNVDGEARELLNIANGGIYTPPEDPTALISAIMKLKNNPPLRTEMGKNGCDLTRKHYSRSVLAGELETMILHSLNQ